MTKNDLDVATACGIEELENKTETRKLRRKWNKTKLILSVFGQSKLFLSLTHKLMYKNWELFCEQRYKKFQFQIRQGFVGNTVIIKRIAFDKIGYWDERQQGADFDLYFRTLERAKTFGDMKPVHICLDSFVHHYIRLTAKQKYPPFADAGNLMSISEKWGDSMVKDYVSLMNN